MQNKRIPSIIFKTRAYDNNMNGETKYVWQDLTSDDLFLDKRVVLFSLPGAFTPTCSTYQLPGFEANADAIKTFGIDDIYCISVNDSFVMNQWAKNQKLSRVKVIPDGAGTFTMRMGMLVDKKNLGFGMRSWRYAAIVNDGIIEKWFQEPGIEDNCGSDPYGETAPEKILEYLQDHNVSLRMRCNAQCQKFADII